MKEVASNPLNPERFQLAFSVLRVPFFLEPGYPEDVSHVETNRERLIKKWGGKEGWEAQKHRHNLKGRGEEAGIEHFNLDRLVGNSLASHRLIQHVGKKYGLGASEALYDRLNEYYFVEGKSLNDKPQLAQVASIELAKLVPKGTSPEEISPFNLLKFLQSDQGREEISMVQQALATLGIHSIPKFILEGTTVLDGAVHWTTLVDCFREIENRGEVRNGPVFAEMLGVDEKIVTKGSFVG